MLKRLMLDTDAMTKGLGYADIATWNCRVRRVTQTRLGIYEGSQNNCFSKLFLFIAWFLSEGSSGRGLTSALTLAPKWFVSVNKLFVIELFVGRRLRADPSTGRLIGVKLSHRSAWMATESITFQTPLLAAEVGPTDYLAACWVPSSSCDTCRK